MEFEQLMCIWVRRCESRRVLPVAYCNVDPSLNTLYVYEASEFVPSIPAELTCYLTLEDWKEYDHRIAEIQNGFGEDSDFLKAWTRLTNLPFRAYSVFDHSFVIRGAYVVEPSNIVDSACYLDFSDAFIHKLLEEKSEDVYFHDCIDTYLSWRAALPEFIHVTFIQELDT